jgi:hypothetical protein
VVIGERFAWCHLPKTAGDATLTPFRFFPELILFADDESTNDKHTAFEARKEQIRGKLLVSGIRRLPAWMLSHAQSEAFAGLCPDYTPLPLPSPDELSERALADYMINHFTPHGRLQIDRWIRTEHLLHDFLELFDEIATVTDEQRRQVLELGVVHSLPYEHDLPAWFAMEQIARMYANNSRWGAVERGVYGSTYLDEC